MTHPGPEAGPPTVTRPDLGHTHPARGGVVVAVPPETHLNPAVRVDEHLVVFRADDNGCQQTPHTGPGPGWPGGLHQRQRGQLGLQLAAHIAGLTHPRTPLHTDLVSTRHHQPLPALVGMAYEAERMACHQLAAVAHSARPDRPRSRRCGQDTGPPLLPVEDTGEHPGLGLSRGTHFIEIPRRGKLIFLPCGHRAGGLQGKIASGHRTRGVGLTLQTLTRQLEMTVTQRHPCGGHHLRQLPGMEERGLVAATHRLVIDQLALKRAVRGLVGEHQLVTDFTVLPVMGDARTGGLLLTSIFAPPTCLSTTRKISTAVLPWKIRDWRVRLKRASRGRSTIR